MNPDVRTILLPTDTTTRGAVLRTLSSPVPGTLPDFVRDDGETLALVIADPDPLGDGYVSRIIPDGTTAALVLGNPDLAPTGGTFALAYGGDSTGLASVPFNVDPAQLQTALNRNPARAADGPVTVTKLGNDLLIADTLPGVRQTLAVDGSLLSPPCAASVVTVQAGSANVPQVVAVSIAQGVLASQTAWAPLPVAGATVSIVTAGTTGTAAVQSVTLDPPPYAGSFALDGKAIPWNASATGFAAAYGIAPSAVVQTGPFTWQYTQANPGAFVSPAPDLTNLRVPTGFLVTINLSTIPFLLAFAATQGNALAVQMAFRVTFPGQLPKTFLLEDVTVFRSVLNVNNLSAALAPNYPPPAQLVLTNDSRLPQFTAEKYGALGDAATDDAPAIQDALAACAAAGGGVVTLRPGVRYAISPGIIQIPAFVTLDGGHQSAVGRQVVTYGPGQPVTSPTASGQFVLLGGANASDTDPAYITLSGVRSALVGAAFFDPGNPSTLAAPVPKPFAVRASVYDYTIRRIELVNPYRGIDIQAGRGWCGEITGNPLSLGIRVDQGYDFNHFWSWHFVDSFVRGTAMDPWFTANSTSYQFLDNDGISAWDIVSFSYHTSLELAASPVSGRTGAGATGSYGHLSGLFDGCTTGVKDSATQAVGMNLSGVRISPGPSSPPAPGVTPDYSGLRGYLGTATKTGLTRLQDCSFWSAGDANVEIQNGQVQVKNCNLTVNGKYSILASLGGQIDIADNVFSGAGSVRTIAVTGTAVGGCIHANNTIMGSTGAVDIASSSAGVVIGLGNQQIIQYSNHDYTNAGGHSSHIALTNPDPVGQSNIAAVFGSTRGGQLRFDYQGNLAADPGAGGTFRVTPSAPGQASKVTLSSANGTLYDLTLSDAGAVTVAAH